MEQTIQMEGLDRFLTAIYGEKTGLASMLEALGFEPEQSRMLTEEHMGAVAAQFVEAIRKKLTSGNLDLWFRILNRRYGLDGEPAASIEEAAQALQLDVASATSAENDALQKCRYKTTLQDLKKELHRIALAELSHGGGRAREGPGGEQAETAGGPEVCGGPDTHGLRGQAAGDPEEGAGRAGRARGGV